MRREHRPAASPLQSYLTVHYQFYSIRLKRARTVYALSDHVMIKPSSSVEMSLLASGLISSDRTVPLCPIPSAKNWQAGNSHRRMAWSEPAVATSDPLQMQLPFFRISIHSRYKWLETCFFEGTHCERIAPSFRDRELHRILVEGPHDASRSRCYSFIKNLGTGFNEKTRCILL